MTLAELLSRHPAVPRRTAQRWLSQLVAEGGIIGKGEGRARRYLAARLTAPVASAQDRHQDNFPAHIPLSADSRDVLAYVDQPLKARKPVGYQRDFLEAYELARVELLRDVFVWAYERSTQEYMTIKQELAEPDPIRLAYRNLIKQIIRSVVTHPGDDVLTAIEQGVTAQVAEVDRSAVQSLIIEELRRLHEGVLARYGVRASEFETWKARQMSRQPP